MRHKFLLPALTLCAAMLFPSCAARSAAPGEAEERDSEIFLVESITNYDRYCGVFLDAGGDVYGFNFIPVVDDGSQVPLMEKLECFRKYTDPLCHIDEAETAALYACGQRLDPDAQLTEKFVQYDTGQSTVYYYDNDTEEAICCYSEGYYEIVSSDRYAKRFNRLWTAAKQKASLEAFASRVGPTLYSSVLDIPSDGLRLEGNYILFGGEQLVSLSEKSGVPLDSVLDDMPESWRDVYAYFVVLTKNSPPMIGLMQQGGSYEIMYGSGAQQEMCYVIALHPSKIGEEFYTSEGEPWQTLS